MLLHADVDAFFVAVARRADPDLGGPLVVAEEVVACAAYEARALGVRAGMPLGRVRRRWPQVRVVAPDPESCARASAELFALFGQVATQVEPGSSEEAFLAVPGDPVAVARALRRRARDELGLPLSVGIGRTKLIAKIASRRAKPDGLVVVGPDEEALLRPALPVAELWGVGPATVARLHAAGLRTVADVAATRPGELAQAVPPAAARVLRAIADGTDDAVLRPPRPRRSVRAQRTVSPPSRARSRVHAALADAVEAALDRLGADRPRRIEVFAHLDDGSVRTVRDTADPRALADQAAHLLDRTGWEADGRGVRLVGMGLTLARPADPDQLALPWSP